MPISENHEQCFKCSYVRITRYFVTLIHNVQKSMYACCNFGGTVNMPKTNTLSAELLKSSNHYSNEGKSVNIEE